MANYIFIVQYKANNKWMDLHDIKPSSCLQIITQDLAEYRKNHVLGEIRIIQKNSSESNTIRKRSCC
jgi:hypothetical protein